MFGDDSTSLGIAPSTNFDSPRTSAFKLLRVQGKLKKKLERKKRRLSIGSYAIVDAIINFTIGKGD